MEIFFIGVVVGVVVGVAATYLWNKHVTLI